MSRVYRILRRGYARSPFDGEGAYRYGGRWSSPGIRIAYASEHQSLAMLEYFVHLDMDDPPDDLVLAVAEIPDDLQREQIDIPQLPANWREPAAPPQLTRFGNEFVKRRQGCVLLIPSVISPSENNCLINPDHPDFERIVIAEFNPLTCDPRVFGRRRGHPRRRS